jgi:uncharacterized protein YjdB
MGTATIRLPVHSISISPTSATMTVGSAQQFTATPRDSLGNALTGRVISWSTTNTAKATVSNTGVVTAVDSGLVSVRAVSEGKNASASITILVPVGSVTLVLGGFGPILPSFPRPMTVTVRDASGKPLAGRRVTWSSSNTAIATITPSATPSITDPNGQATATFRSLVLNGNVTITAVVDGVTGTLAINLP